MQCVDARMGIGVSMCTSTVVNKDIMYALFISNMPNPIPKSHITIAFHLPYTMTCNLLIHWHDETDWN